MVIGRAGEGRLTFIFLSFFISTLLFLFSTALLGKDASKDVVVEEADHHWLLFCLFHPCPPFRYSSHRKIGDIGARGVGGDDLNPFMSFASFLPFHLPFL